MNHTALSAQGLHVSLGGQPVLHGVDVAFAAGKWTAIVGPNGAGKSTLLKALSGLLPAQGVVQLAGQPLLQLSKRELAQRVSWLGQNEAASDDLRVWDVVMLGRLPFQDWMAVPSAASSSCLA